jgi:hypothetical protein
VVTARDNIEKRLAQLKRAVPTRGFERYPSVLKSLSDLPTELQSPSLKYLAIDDTLQTIIAFPAQIHRGWHYVPQQALLFIPAGVIHILASIWPDEAPQILFIRGCDLLYVKITLVLLYGLLEIVADGHGSLLRISVEFNTVAWERLSLPLRQLLQITKNTSNPLTERNSFPPLLQQALEKLPLKFINGVKIFGVLFGEELEEIVFQQGTWKRWLFLIRRPTLANTLLLLTSNYFVVIQEDPTVGQGWIISYLPRDCIAGIQNQPQSLGNEVDIQLTREEQTLHFKLLLSREVTLALHELWVRHGSQWQDIKNETEKETN